MPVSLRIDGKPKEISQIRKKIWNLLSVESAVLTLNAIRVRGVYGWANLFSTVWSRGWLKDIKRQAPGQYLASVRGLPRYLSNLTRAFVVAAVYVPWTEIQKPGASFTRRLSEVVKGWTNFFRQLTLGSVDLVTRATVDTLALLEKGELLLLDNENESLETTGKPRSKFAQQPISTKEGFQQAYQALLRQLKDVKDQIVLVPLDEYEKHGTPAYLKSMAKAVPIALLKPVMGTAEGLSKILLGLRNTLDPTKKQDMDDKYG